MKNLLAFSCVNFILLTSLIVILPPAQADDALSIAQKIYDRDDGKDSWAEGEMILVDEGGKERPRKLITATKDFGELSKRYIKFTEPAAINGTSFLSLEQHEDSDEQFLYLPSVKRVRRIAADQKDRSFVNTDFTYEDLERRKVERDNYKLLRSEVVLGKDCYVLERVAKDEDDSQYEKTFLWAAKDSYLVVKSEMYKDGKLYKKFDAKDVKKIDGIWTVMESLMHDLSNDHRTVSKTINIRYNKGVPDDVFTQKYLEKVN